MKDNLFDRVTKQNLWVNFVLSLIQKAFKVHFPGNFLNYSKGLKSLQQFFFRQIQVESLKLSAHLIPVLNALAYAISQQPLSKEISIENSALMMLLESAVNSIEGSLMQESMIKLISVFVQSNADLYRSIVMTIPKGEKFLIISY